MKLSDFVAQFVAQHTNHVFTVVGGGAMHLNDSFGHCEGLTPIYNLHEQAAAIGAEAYAKYTGGLGCCVVTTGPGATNAMTGLATAWVESTPVLFISGQVKRADMIGRRMIRQCGVQELDTLSFVEPLTKYAYCVTNPIEIQYQLEAAVWEATHNRPGPVWIDIPLDVQAADVDPDILEHYHAPEPDNDGILATQVGHLLEALSKAKRPILFLGNGVRLGKAEDATRKLIDLLGIPVLLTWAMHDFLPDNHPQLVGRSGPFAPRYANFALQNCDFLLSIGSRLGTIITGYNPASFAPKAIKAMVDVDWCEVTASRIPLDYPIKADANEFINEFINQIDFKRMPFNDYSLWHKQIKDWRIKYPLALPTSTYILSDALSDQLAGDDILISGSSGVSIEIFLLVFRAKAGQRIISSPSLSAMGYGLPAAIGACIASGRRTILIDGDGSFQLNIQELETIHRLNLPVKMFVFNNGGYSIIRASQTRAFGRVSGADADSGVTLPDLGRIAEAYGIGYHRIDSTQELSDELDIVLNCDGPVLCEVMTSWEEQRQPMITTVQREDGSFASTPLEDLYPFLERDELQRNML